MIPKKKNFLSLPFGQDGHLEALAVVEDGVGEGAVALVLDGLPAVVKELEEAPEDGSGLLLGESQGRHGVNGTACPLLVGNHPAPIRLAVRHSGERDHRTNPGEERIDQCIALLGFATAIWAGWGKGEKPDGRQLIKGNSGDRGGRGEGE
jgi:hypothetical protein